MRAATFSKRVLTWFDAFGRKHLPWQQDVNAYRVWVSEIMLQQTQVATVIDYFNRFMITFPTVRDLAQASEDQVLHLWTGLGYYARARNLHKTAKLICDNHQGEFPRSLETLITLPGIGRSTAGAIISLSYDLRATILDGNVKRVLTRFHAISGWPAEAAVEKKLWALAEHYTPHARCGEYTQAMMDLGATVCTRANPRCEVCPLKENCQARIEQCIADFPGKKPKKTLPIKKTILLLIQNQQQHVLLKKRPNKGIWGGLWSLPEFSDASTLKEKCHLEHQLLIKSIKPLTPFRHTFTHYHLDITPVMAQLSARSKKQVADKNSIWYNVRAPKPLGFAAPVKRLLRDLIDDQKS